MFRKGPIHLRVNTVYKCSCEMTNLPACKVQGTKPLDMYMY